MSCVLMLVIVAVCAAKRGDEMLTASCSSDMDCSLNGACLQNGTCACDAPWHGDTCGLLGFATTPTDGAYGFGEPFAVTSWGGNAIEENGTWHGYFTEIGGARCGLHMWHNQSTVVHAVSTNPSGPYTKVSTVLYNEAQNPQAIHMNNNRFPEF